VAEGSAGTATLTVPLAGGGRVRTPPNGAEDAVTRAGR
jgi:hypothetical protein